MTPDYQRLCVRCGALHAIALSRYCDYCLAVFRDCYRLTVGQYEHMIALGVTVGDYKEHYGIE